MLAYYKYIRMYILSHSYIFTSVSATVYANCTDGEVRLANGTTDQVAGITDGRLEICYNHAWGTVCQNSFQSSEASVTCSQMGQFRSE